MKNESSHQILHSGCKLRSLSKNTTTKNQRTFAFLIAQARVYTHKVYIRA